MNPKIKGVFMSSPVWFVAGVLTMLLWDFLYSWLTGYDSSLIWPHSLWGKLLIGGFIGVFWGILEVLRAR